MDRLKRRMEEAAALVGRALAAAIVPDGSPQGIVLEAMRYSVDAGGKRIRPLLVIETARMLGKEPGEDTAACACAVEMAHTYSLIHDDLPCMDDDDLRRGQPSCHVRFGEDIALLAGDALLTHAFEVLAGAQGLSDSAKAQCCLALARAAGTGGMLGGQVIDLQSEGKEIDEALHRQMCRLKTGALFSVCGQMGCICAGASEEQRQVVERYCQSFGLVFQAVDDILDVCGDEAALGKPVGSDAANHKNTFVTLYGLEGARRLAGEWAEQGILALAPFGEAGETLRELMELLLNRKA